jgi:FMN phosphatase YigB (HAD superfamily)
MLSNQIHIHLICIDFDGTLLKGHFHNAMFGLQVSPELEGNEPVIVSVTDENLEKMTLATAIVKARLETNSASNPSILNYPKDFKELINKTIESGHQIGIVTYGQYPSAVIAVLRKILNNDSLLKKIPIAMGLPEEKPDIGKEKHIQLLIDHFNSAQKIRIDRKDCLLVDDNKDNIEIANKASDGFTVLAKTEGSLEIDDDEDMYKFPENISFILNTHIQKYEIIQKLEKQFKEKFYTDIYLKIYDNEPGILQEYEKHYSDFIRELSKPAYLALSQQIHEATDFKNILDAIMLSSMTQRQTFGIIQEEIDSLHADIISHSTAAPMIPNYLSGHKRKENFDSDDAQDLEQGHKTLKK